MPLALSRNSEVQTCPIWRSDYTRSIHFTNGEMATARLKEYRGSPRYKLTDLSLPWKSIFSTLDAVVFPLVGNHICDKCTHELRNFTREEDSRNIWDDILKRRWEFLNSIWTKLLAWVCYLAKEQTLRHIATHLKSKLTSGLATNLWGLAYMRTRIGLLGANHLENKNI